MKTFNYFGQIGLNLMDGWKIDVKPNLAGYKFWRLSPFLEFPTNRPCTYNRDYK